MGGVRGVIGGALTLPGGCSALGSNEEGLNPERSTYGRVQDHMRRAGGSIRFRCLLISINSSVLVNFCDICDEKMQSFVVLFNIMRRSLVPEAQKSFCADKFDQQTKKQIQFLHYGFFILCVLNLL